MDLKLLNDSKTIMKPSDFSYIDKEISVVMNEYKKLMVESTDRQICELPDDRFHVKFCIKYLHHLQDFYVLFYLSLLLTTHYSDNASIVCIGESPNRFIFTQSLFYYDNNTKNFVEKNKFPKNLNFDYLPLSGLGNLYDLRIFPPVNAYLNNDDEINFFVERFEYVDFSQIFEYLKKHKYDAESIALRDNQTIFVDRVETYRSLVIFLYLYYRMYNLLPNNELKAKFLKNFKIVGFDGDYDPPDISDRYKRIISNYIKFLFKLDDSQKEIANNMFSMQLFFINMPVKVEQIIPYYDATKTNAYIYLLKNHFIVDKVINQSSLPERQNNVRCVIQRKLSKINEELLDTLNISENKQPNDIPFSDESGNNCNLINYIISLVFYKLKNSATFEINRLILYFKYIDITRLSLLEMGLIPKDIEYYFRFDISAGVSNPCTNYGFNTSKNKLLEILFGPENLKYTIFDPESTYNLPLILDSLSPYLIERKEFILRTEAEANNLIPIKSGGNLKYYQKYKKYKNKYMALKFGGDGESKKILYLDFDETLGSFHMNIKDFYLVMKKHKIDFDYIKHILRQLLQMGYMRSYLKEFLNELKILKNSGKINKIIIYTRNIDRTEYIPTLVSLILDICDVIDLIEPEIKFTNGIKDLSGNEGDIIYIIDDKCDHCVPKEKCISVEPYLAYIHYTIFVELLTDISEEIKEIIKRELLGFSNEDFDKSKGYNYIKQYQQFGDSIMNYRATIDDPVKFFPDTELLRVLEIIKSIYV